MTLAQTQRCKSKQRLSVAGVLIAGIFIVPQCNMAYAATNVYTPSVYIPGASVNPFIPRSTITRPGEEEFFEGVRFPFTLRFDASEAYDDNIFYSNLNRRGSWVTTLRPTFTVPLRFRNNVYQFGYSVEGLIFENSSRDNVVNNYLFGRTELEFGRRNHLLIEGGLDFANDRRGTFFSEGQLANSVDDPDEYQNRSIGVNYRYGATGAKGQLEVYTNYVGRVYQNNRERTAERDLDSILVGGRFAYRVQPKTRLLLEFNNTFLEYLNNTQLVGQDRRYLGGLEWDATAKTSGTVKVGYFERTFDNSEQASGGGIAVDAAVVWRPKTYSVVRLAALNSSGETTGFGGFIDSENYSIEWTHSWLARFDSYVRGAFGQATYKGGVNRDDEIYGFTIGVNYRPRRWLTAGAEYSLEERNSSPGPINEQFTYSRNVVLFNVRVTP